MPPSPRVPRRASPPPTARDRHGSNSSAEEASGASIPGTLAERRQQHNSVERSRREALNAKFTILANSIPSLQHVHRPSKSTIITHCLEMTSELRELRSENQRLREELLLLQQQNSSQRYERAISPKSQYSPPSNSLHYTEVEMMNPHTRVSRSQLAQPVASHGRTYYDHVSLHAPSPDHSQFSIDSLSVHTSPAMSAINPVAYGPYYHQVPQEAVPLSTPVYDYGSGQPYPPLQSSERQPTYRIEYM